MSSSVQNARTSKLEATAFWLFNNVAEGDAKASPTAHAAPRHVLRLLLNPLTEVKDLQLQENLTKHSNTFTIC